MPQMIWSRGKSAIAYSVSHGPALPEAMPRAGINSFYLIDHRCVGTKRFAVDLASAHQDICGRRNPDCSVRQVERAAQPLLAFGAFENQQLVTRSDHPHGAVAKRGMRAPQLQALARERQERTGVIFLKVDGEVAVTFSERQPRLAGREAEVRCR